jgi:CRISPR-associated protein Cas1
LFIQRFEDRLNEDITHPDVQSKVSYRRAIQLQVQRYKRSLLQDIAYEAFLRSV